MIQYAIKVFKEEAEAIVGLISYLDDNFENVVKEILNSSGRVIVTGVGKSGIIGKKISSSLASTGTPSFFLHPTEAFHGDLGMIKSDDIIITITKSGETDEVLKLVPFIHNNGNILVSITGNPKSTMARSSKFHLNIHSDKEVCPLNLAPTTSALTTLAMGDALVVALMEERRFEPKDYARYHPGGNLGWRLLNTAKDIMRTTDLPIISKEMLIGEVLFEISKSRMGIAIVMEKDDILGIITDGDIRRLIQNNMKSFFYIQAKDCMNTTPIKIGLGQSVDDIERIMKEKKVHTLLVTDGTGKLCGIVGYQDLK